MASEDSASDVKPLFPVQSVSSRPSLFPVNAAASSTSRTSGNNGDGDLDWLENKSFIPTSILLAQEEEGESAGSRGASSPETSVKRELGDARQPSFDEEHQDAIKTEIKRSLSESESDEESVPAHRPSKSRDHSRTKEKKKHKKKKKKHKHKEEKQRSSTEDSKDSKLEDPSEFWKTQTTKTFLQEMPGLQPEFAFRLDRKAEKALWNYESVYKGNIARYRRLTNNCLGKKDLYVGEKTDRGKDTSHRYYSKDNRKEARRKGVPVAVDKRVENKTAQYISVREKAGGETESSSHAGNPLGVLDSATSLYVQGKAPAAGQGKDEEEETPVDETLERMAFYNRRLQQDPGNVKLWTEFVSFQDRVFQDARFSAQSVGSRRMREAFQPPRACIEKKLAILEKALGANPSSLELKLLKLELAQDVSEASSLAKEWDDLLFVHAGDVRLWRHYLAFQQSRLATFAVNRVVKLYQRCFRTLGPILEGRVKLATRRSETLEEDLIGVFEQYCHFLQQSGFTEKAVASYQALMEFNLFRPPSLNLAANQDSAAVFESFWDSGVARFGEPGAKGWASWVDAPDKSYPTCGAMYGSTEEEQERILQQGLPAWQTWLRIERLRQSVHWWPWRPDASRGETEDECEDLDRLVLYDDVAPVLFCMQRSASFSRLVHSFVDLLGLVQRPDGGGAVAAAGGGGGGGGGDGAAGLLHFDQLKLCSLYQVPPAALVGASTRVDGAWHPRAEAVCFLEEVLRQSAAYFSGYQRSLFSCQLLRLQAEKHGCGQDVSQLSEKARKEVRRFGKGLLKEVQNRNDLALWDAFIRGQWALGKETEALSMLQTALAMFTATADGQDHAQMAGLCSLYRTLAEIHLHFSPLELVSRPTRKPSPPTESKNKALSSFGCLAERAGFQPPKGDAVPAALVLRTRRKFQSGVTELLGDAAQRSGGPSAARHAVLLVNCFALFELCAGGVRDAVRVFEEALRACSAGASSQKALLPSRGARCAWLELERDLHHALLVLLKGHTAVSAVSLSDVRCHLDRALSRFPDDPWLLCQFADMELRTFLAGRLRRYFETAGQDPASVYPLLCGALAELGRHAKLLAASENHCQGEGMSDSGIVHRVRAACERGLRCKSAQHCPLLWRMYLTFEAQYGNKDRAKGVFYRALQACPWSKALCMDGAELFGEHQLQELVDLMTEKELRVQIPLEEVDLLRNSEPQGPEEEGEEEDPEKEELEEEEAS